MSGNKPIRVLIVDDNELTRSLLGVIMRSGDYQVVGEATTAKEGLEMARKLHPDVVLLDHNMPNGYGVDIVAPLRTSLPNAVILMVTTQNEKKMIDLALERGANGFVVKPFNTASVLETMRSSTGKFVIAAAARLI
ncbi:response regulator [Massilia sp. W12]|uniref:response regulator n=1 Tax=Massilia sp. W12 TaxID=3126507 RepID=UPI0030D16607